MGEQKLWTSIERAFLCEKGHTNVDILATINGITLQRHLAPHYLCTGWTKTCHRNAVLHCVAHVIPPFGHLWNRLCRRINTIFLAQHC